MLRPPELAASATGPQTSTPDHVMMLIILAGIALTLWFVLKAATRPGWSLALFRRLDPFTQSAKTWVAAAPLTFSYIAVWTVTTVLQQGAPEPLNDILARSQSTNIVGISTQPIRVLFSSAFIVADSGIGFLGYIAVYVMIVARLEHQLGAARTLVIAVVAHALGSMLTVTVEMWAIGRGLAPESLKYTVDVGVSYVMVGSVGAYLWLVSRRWLPWLAGSLMIGVVVPMIVWHTIWDLGHFLAALLGTAAGAIAARYPRRSGVTWRDLLAQLNPRELPTFPDEPRPWPTPHN